MTSIFSDNFCCYLFACYYVELYSFDHWTKVHIFLVDSVLNFGDMDCPSNSISRWIIYYLFEEIKEGNMFSRWKSLWINSKPTYFIFLVLIICIHLYDDIFAQLSHAILSGSDLHLSIFFSFI